MSKPTFRSDAFIFTPSKMAAQLSALSQRPMVFQRIPKCAVGGKPLQARAALTSTEKEG